LFCDGFFRFLTFFCARDAVMWRHGLILVLPGFYFVKHNCKLSATRGVRARRHGIILMGAIEVAVVMGLQQRIHNIARRKVKGRNAEKVARRRAAHTWHARKFRTRRSRVKRTGGRRREGGGGELACPTHRRLRAADSSYGHRTRGGMVAFVRRLLSRKGGAVGTIKTWLRSLACVDGTGSA